MDLNLLTSPRVILMIFYPGSFYPERHIYQCKTPTIRTQYQKLEWYQKYPKIFRELKWWEYRTEQELLESAKYVICINQSRPNKPIKVKKYYLDADCYLPYVLDEDDITSGYLHMCIPITKEEYDSYLELSKDSL